MTDIVQFLSDRLAEDEAATGLTSPSPWRVETMPHRTNVVVPAEGIDRVGTAGRRLDITPVFTGQTAGSSRAQWEADAQHIARYDPARVLREVAAKRGHLELWRDACERRDRALKLAESEQPLMQKAAISARAEANGLCEAVGRILLLDARIYADHPDYAPEWRPE